MKDNKMLIVKKAFTMMEILVVIVMISAGVLPIYSLLHSSNRRVANTDTRVLATIIGTSAIELVKTIGYDKISANIENIELDTDFQNLRDNAQKNGFELLQPEITVTDIKCKNEVVEQMIMVVIKVQPKNRPGQTKEQIIPFMTLLTNPRSSYY